MEIKFTSWNEVINRDNERCYKRFNWTLQLFPELHKNKPKIHSLAAVEAYKNSDGSCGLTMHFLLFFSASLFSIRFDKWCNRISSREVTRKWAGPVVLPTTELPFKLSPADSFSILQTPQLCICLALLGSLRQLGTSRLLNECKMGGEMLRQRRNILIFVGM